MKEVFTIFCLALLMGNCKPKSQDQIKEDDKSYLDPYLDAIRISASAEQPEDSTHGAKIHFKETEFNFGDLKEGDTVRISFPFVNKGNARLLVNRVSTSCGCTRPEWPKGFIQPGDSGVITALFVSNEKSGLQEKIISVFTNSNPPQTDLKIKGNVLK
ncbi:MAG: DUF1573 domain-containing protein [Saprospiraceae bacterium]|nr:DUF1573 domain-containing protein [Saprospiraceae bacterium]